MKLSLQQFYQSVFSFKWRILILAVLVYLLALFSITGLEWEEYILNTFPDADPEINEYQEILADFNPINAMIIDIGFIEGKEGSEEQLITVADSLHQIMSASLFFSKISYKWEYSDLLFTLEILNKFLPVLFNEQDEQIIKQKISAEAIERKFQEWKRTLAESPAPFLSKQFLSDPLNFNELAMNKLNALQSKRGAIQIYNGRLFTHDLKHLLIIAYPNIAITDSRRSTELVNFMANAIRQAEGEIPLDAVSIAYISGHRFSMENAKRIKSDVKLTLTISLVAISILSLLVYSRPLLMLLTLLPAIFGITLALGSMRWIVPNISAVIIGSGAMLIGISVDYGIHFLFHVDQSANKEAVTGIISRLTRPLLLGAATTLVAFLALQISILPSYRQLGKFVAFGIGGALAFVLFVLPLLLPRRKEIKLRQPLLPVTHFFQRFYKFVLQKRLFVFVLIFLISAAAAAGLFKLRFEGDVQKLNAVSPEIQHDWDQVLRSFGDAISSTYAAVKGKTMQEVLQKNEVILSQLSRLQEEGLIESFTSIANILPSDLKQEKNRKRWQKFFNERTIQKIDQNINSACLKNGIRAEIFDEFIGNLKNTHGYLQIEDIAGTLLNDVLSNQLSLSENKAIILSNIKLNTPENFVQLKSRLKNALPDIILYNGTYFVKQMVFLIFKELKRIGAIAIFFIILLLLLYKRKISIAITILLPLVLSLFWTFGIMGWFGIKINIINCIFSVFVFGLVVDYCIFLVSSFDLHQTEGDGHLARTSGAITISALTTMFGLGALVLAKHPALHSLGLTALLGIGSGLIAVLLIIPAFYSKFNPFLEKEYKSSKILRS